MRIISENLNGLFLDTLSELNLKGSRKGSRNGDVIFSVDPTLILTNPKNRYLALPGRTNNIYATMAEALWVLAGRSDVEFLSKFMKRAKDYSDDGVTWRGSYGPRLYNHDQINHVLDSFSIEGRDTRRAVMTIYQPEMDTRKSIHKMTGSPETKDQCCSQWLAFWIYDNKLNCKLVMRSNDLLFGMSHINVFEFTLLQEVIMELLKKRPGFENLGLGSFIHNPLDLHIYEQPAVTKQVEAILNAGEEPYDVDCMSELPIMKIHNKSNQTHLRRHARFLTEIIDTNWWKLDRTPASRLEQYAYLAKFWLIRKEYTEVPVRLLNSLDKGLRTAVFHSTFSPQSWKDFLSK